MQYCEQLVATGGFEAWNAVTNIAFVLAAAAAARQARRDAIRLSAGAASLLAIAVAIGLGSFAWHASHAKWAELADIVPILLFVMLFLFIAARRLLGASSAVALFACIGTLAAVLGLGIALPRALNGSLAYVPVLAGLAILAWRASKPEAKRLLVHAAAVFTLSLVARTADLEICDAFRHGSHWIWHLCNGVVIYLALRTVLTSQRPAG